MFPINKFADFDKVFEVEDYMLFYSRMLTDVVSKEQVKFLINHLGIKMNDMILDVPCGFGRHANLLAEYGYRMAGLDNSRGFLDIAEKAAKERSLDINYIQADMRDFSMNDKFDAAYMLFTSFGYFDDAVNKKVLGNISNVLKTDGHFCVDLFNRDIFLRDYQPYIVTEVGDALMIDRNHFDCRTGRLYNDRIVMKNGEERRKPFFTRLYNLTEMEKLLKDIGFSIKEIFEDYQGKPFISTSRKMVIICQKK